jgi:dUTP pyrophosphatase
MTGTRVRCVAESGASLPEYKSELAAGADLRAFLQDPLRVAPGARVAVPTGLRIELEPGWEAQVRPRSGLAFEKGLTVLNAPGTIDADYRGEVKVLLVNLGSEAVEILPGDRIAQLVVAPCARASFELAEGLGQSARGSGGFGSSGR